MQHLKKNDLANTTIANVISVVDPGGALGLKIPSLDKTIICSANLTKYYNMI